MGRAFESRTGAVLAGATRLFTLSPPGKLYIESQNRSLLSGLSRDYGYVMRNRVKEGCDYNWRLEHPDAILDAPPHGSGVPDALSGVASSGASPAAATPVDAIAASAIPAAATAAPAADAAVASAAPTTGIQGRGADTVATAGMGARAALTSVLAAPTVTSQQPADPTANLRTGGSTSSSPSTSGSTSSAEPYNNITRRYEAACQLGSSLTLTEDASVAPAGGASGASGGGGGSALLSALPEMEEWFLVPRLLHQTWKSCDVLPRQRAWWDRCARLSPTWRMALWTDAANRAFIAAHYPQHLDMYAFLPSVPPDNAPLRMPCYALYLHITFTAHWHSQSPSAHCRARFLRYDSYNINIKRVDAIRYFLLYHCEPARSPPEPLIRLARVLSPAYFPAPRGATTPLPCSQLASLACYPLPTRSLMRTSRWRRLHGSRLCMRP